MMLIGFWHICILYQHKRIQKDYTINLLFHVNAKITQATGKSFRSSHYARAVDAEEAGKMVAASLSDMGYVKIGKAVVVDTDGIWIAA